MLATRHLMLLPFVAALLPFAAQTGADVLFLDTFQLTAPNPNTTDVNFQDATRQSGSLAPLTYTKGDEPVFSQVGNIPNALLLAGRAAGLPGDVSIDHNFTTAPGINHIFNIQFDVNPVLPGADNNVTQSSWVCIDFGSSAAGRNLFPQFTDGIGLLFRGNGESEAFDNGTFQAANNFAPGVDDLYHHISIQFTDTVDGNPFDGSSNPILINAYADNNPVPFFSYLHPTNFTSDYLSFVGEGEGSGGAGVVVHGLTNIEVSIDPVPEPAAMAILGSSILPLFIRRRRASRR